MAHTSGFLSGPEPEELEEKTAAQIEDEHQTESMRASRSMYQLAEDDSTPAIEQHTARQSIIQADKTKPKIQVNKDFEAEMAARAQKEHELKAKREAEAEREKAKREAEEKRKLEEELSHAQEVDPEKIKERRINENFKANLQKIYPDRLEQYDKVDDALWKKRISDENPLPERAKLVDEFNSELRSKLIISGALQLLSVVIFVMTITTPSAALKLIFTFLNIGVLTAAILFMHQGGKKCHRNIVPSTQRFLFTMLSIFPTLALRIIIALPLLIYGNMFGQLLAMAISAFIGGAIQYDLLNRYHVPTTMYLVVLNTIVFNIFAFAGIMGRGDQFGIVTFVIGFPIYFSVENLAYKVSKRPN